MNKWNKQLGLTRLFAQELALFIPGPTQTVYCGLYPDRQQGPRRPTRGTRYAGHTFAVNNSCDDRFEDERAIKTSLMANTGECKSR